MRRRARRSFLRDPLWAGLLTVVVIAAASAAVVSGFNPLAGEKGRVYVASFSTARQVNTKTPVRIDGVQVGRVEKVGYDATRRVARVRFRIEDDDVVLRRDADIALRWRTVLGGRMELAVDPGSRSAAPLRGSEIPRASTRVQTELEDVARVVRGNAKRGLRTTLRELPDALGGNDAGRALAGLDGLSDLTPAARALRGQHRADLPGLVEDANRLTTATAGTERSLGRLVESADETLSAVAARRAELRGTLAAAPAALDETVRIAREIDRTLPDVDGLIGDLRPGARRLAPVLRRADPTLRLVNTTLREARPLLTALRPALPRLASAATQGTAALDALRPTSARLERDLIPYLERKDDEVELPVYQLVGPGFASANAGSGLYSENSHVVNFPISLGERSQGLLPCTTLLTDPTAKGDLVKCENLEGALGALLGVRSRTASGTRSPDPRTKGDTP